MGVGVVHIAPDAAIAYLSGLAVAPQGDDGLPEIARGLGFGEAFGEFFSSAHVCPHSRLAPSGLVGIALPRLALQNRWEIDRLLISSVPPRERGIMCSSVACCGGT